MLHRGLLTVAAAFGWQLEAWALFSNHYHFVAHSPENHPTANTLAIMLARLHERTAKWLNRLDATRGRHVWHNYRETRLTFTFASLQDARLLVLHIEGQGKKDVLAAAEADGPEEDMPIRAVLRRAATPVDIYWAP